MALLHFHQTDSYSVINQIQYDKHSRMLRFILNVYEDSTKDALLFQLPYAFDGNKDYEDVKGTGTEPPGSPTTGDKWCVLASATGDWASQDGRMAVYETDHWNFFDMIAEYLVKSEADSKYYQKDGSTWTENTNTRPYDKWDTDFSPSALSPVDKNIMKQAYEYLKSLPAFSGVTSDE